MSGQIQYGSVVPMTTELTVVSPADADRTRRLERFRSAVHSVSDTPTRSGLNLVLQLAHTLELPEESIASELVLIEALREGREMLDRLDQGELPVVPGVTPVMDRGCYHFVSTARFGRRRADQCGHLLFTTSALQFRGALDLSIQWTEVGHVSRAGREITVSLHESRRVLRFLCSSISEAVRGTLLARHLATAQALS